MYRNSTRSDSLRAVFLTLPYVFSRSTHRSFFWHMQASGFCNDKDSKNELITFKWGQGHVDQSTYLLLTRWAHAPAEREDFSDNESTYDGAEKHQVTEDPVIDDAPKRKEKKKRKRKKCLDIISKVRACPKLAPSLQRHAPLVPATTPPPRSPSVGSRSQNFSC